MYNKGIYVYYIYICLQKYIYIYYIYHTPICVYKPGSLSHFFTTSIFLPSLVCFIRFFPGSLEATWTTLRGKEPGVNCELACLSTKMPEFQVDSDHLEIYRYYVK